METSVHKITKPQKWASGYRSSKLLRFRAELVRLRRSGMSYPGLAAWLLDQHNLKISHSTILRFLEGLPEMQRGTEETPEDSVA